MYFKAFNKNWTCKGYQYEIGQTAVMPEEMIKLYSRGFHFSDKLADCFTIYPFDETTTRIAEVFPSDRIIKGENHIFVTNKLTIVREISWDEVLSLMNIGDYNYGIGNIGIYNIGTNNIGCDNIGHNNSGSYNIGNSNTGDFNIGHGNSGWDNKGNDNSGNHNIGNYNSGDFNIGDNYSGCFNIAKFNSIDQLANYSQMFMFMFNEVSKWTYRDWLNSKAYYILQDMPPLVKIDHDKNRIYIYDKKGAPTKKTYSLIEERDTQERQDWWDNLPDAKKQIIMNIPNFKPNFFEKITSIKIRRVK